MPDLGEAERWMRACQTDVTVLNRLLASGDYSWACFMAHQVGCIHTSRFSVDWLGARFHPINRSAYSVPNHIVRSVDDARCISAAA